MQSWLDALRSVLDVKAIIQWGGILGITVIVFVETGLFFGFFLPGDSLLVTAGILAGAGVLDIRWLILAAALSAVALTTTAADEGNSVTTSQPPYKPSRQIDESDSIKTAREPYKPGRQADDSEQPVGSAKPPYKPGRELDEDSSAGRDSKK